MVRQQDLHWRRDSDWENEIEADGKESTTQWCKVVGTRFCCALLGCNTERSGCKGACIWMSGAEAIWREREQMWDCDDVMLVSRLCALRGRVVQCARLYGSQTDTHLECLTSCGHSQHGLSSSVRFFFETHKNSRLKERRCGI